jgi:hypothetical protein
MNSDIEFQIMTKGTTAMASTRVSQPQPTKPPIQPHLITPAPARIVPVKTGLMGEQGTGKTTTAALLGAALSKLYHGGAPIHVTDPELGWQYLEPVIFKPEGIKLVQRTIPTFKAMLDDIDQAEREGAAVYAVELGKIWIEIVRTLQRADRVNWGMQLRSMWDDFVARFLNSPMHCIVLGRIQDVIEEVIVNDKGDTRSIKVGEGMKAGGQRNNFGYEPNLVIRMNLEVKPRVKKGEKFEDEGRMVHRAHVLKDRTWAINGKVFRWNDRDRYEPGDFKYVWNNLRPHFLAVQKTMAFVKLDASATSEAIVESDSGNGEFYERRQRKEALTAEIKACLDLYFAGQGKEDKQIRLAIGDLIFGVKSSEARDSLSVEALERGLKILQIYERRPTHNLDNQKNVLAEMTDCIKAFDAGAADDFEPPF